MGKYWAIGEVISTDHPEMKKGDYVGLELNKKWPDPYTVFYLVETPKGQKLAYARLRWVKFHKFPGACPGENGWSWVKYG